LPAGLYWVDVEAGYHHTVLRRSDGFVEVCGLLAGEGPAPAVDPGTAYVEIAANHESCLGRIGPPSTYVGITSGCAGSQPPSRLIPRDTPRIGHTLQVNVSNLPVDVAVIAMGWQQIQPLSLGPVGMPGCSLHISTEAVLGLVGQSGFATWELPVPDAPSLVGVEFYNQALVLDPQAGNALGAVVSDAARAVVGDW
jgi:hypothetical protein